VDPCFGGYQIAVGFFWAVREGLFKSFPKTIAYTYIFIYIYKYIQISMCKMYYVGLEDEAFLLGGRPIFRGELLVAGRVPYIIYILFVVFDGTFMWHCSRS